MRVRNTGSFTAAGAGQPMALMGGAFGQPAGLAASIWGTFSGTVVLERSRDGGATWNAVSKDTSGTPASYTAEADINISDGVVGDLYRWHCTTFTSGTINWDMAQ